MRAKISARALTAFQETLALQPDHEDATRLMKELLYERESWEDLVPILEAEFAQLEAKNQKADIAWELARLSRDKLGRKRESVGWLRKGYEARREHPEIVGALVEHYMDAQLWSRQSPYCPGT